MSEEVYRAIAGADSGFVESPAGCGKTEAIVRTVGGFCAETQLVLTHTHAGVDALRQRFRDHSVPSAKFHVDTIAGWAWGWVRKYPDNAGYEGATDIAEWANVYAAMTALLDKDFVARGILNSYAGIIVDEYQDCTLPMHILIARLKALLPCRVLGDELQGIFDFNSEPLVGWADVRTEFRHDLGALDTPHRWIKAENRVLGQWLLDNRGAFHDEREPDYTASPVRTRSISFRALAGELIRLTHAAEGSICIIRPKSRNLHGGLESALVGHGYQVLEANDLGDLKKLIFALSDGTPAAKRNAVFAFLKRVHSGLAQDDQRFIKKILAGENQTPRRADRRELCARHTEGITPHLLRDLLGYCEALASVRCKLRESVSALRCVLEEHCEAATDLKGLYAAETAGRRFHSRSYVHRAIGSTLLVKGLEYDHAVILRGPDWQTSWGGYRDLYVALSRGSKSATLIEMTA
jgi:DNA helicase-2/ATP-dependent DNA helicase PcrA